MSSSDLEGLSSPVVIGDTAYAILSLSGVIVSLDLSVAAAECRAVTNTVVAPRSDTKRSIGDTNRLHCGSLG